MTQSKRSPAISLDDIQHELRNCKRQMEEHRADFFKTWLPKLPKYKKNNSKLWKTLYRDVAEYYNEMEVRRCPAFCRWQEIRENYIIVNGLVIAKAEGGAS